MNDAMLHVTPAQRTRKSRNVFITAEVPVSGRRCCTYCDGLGIRQGRHSKETAPCELKEIREE